MLSKQHMVKVRTKMLVYALFIQDQTDFRGIKEGLHLMRAYCDALVDVGEITEEEADSLIEEFSIEGCK